MGELRSEPTCRRAGKFEALVYGFRAFEFQCLELFTILVGFFGLEVSGSMSWWLLRF